MALKAVPLRKAVYCSFCGKNDDEVFTLISGPGSVYICDECIALAAEIIAEKKLDRGVMAVIGRKPSAAK